MTKSNNEWMPDHGADCEGLPVTDNSKVNLNMMQQIEELKTKLAESEARFGRLSFALYYVINNSTVQNNYPHEVGIVEEILNETKSQSLQHIQAEAIAGYYEYICLHVDYSGDIPTPEEYTDQQTNGSDGE